MKTTFKNFLCEQVPSKKYSYTTFQDFIDFFDDDFFRPEGSKNERIVELKPVEERSDVFKKKSIAGVIAFCQKYFDDTVKIIDLSTGSGKSFKAKIMFAWNEDTPAKAKVLYSHEDLKKMRDEFKGQSPYDAWTDDLYNDLVKMSKENGSKGSLVGRYLNGDINYSTMVGVFLEGPTKGEPFITTDMNVSKLKTGDVVYMLVDLTYGRIKYKGTSR